MGKVVETLPLASRGFWSNAVRSRKLNQQGIVSAWRINTPGVFCTILYLPEGGMLSGLVERGLSAAQ